MNRKSSDPAHHRKADARVLLRTALQNLGAVLGDVRLMEETPIEVWNPLEFAAEAIEAALRALETPEPAESSLSKPTADGPTPQQGQFLAYIREYMRSNYEGRAPTHAALQRFFNLTPPSVSSMLVRLEQRGFIRRVPGVARAIEIAIDPERIPPLERPFKI
jgi:DNA-binding MarR family transcriptional regulator